jgi:hypothetical protein
MADVDRRFMLGAGLAGAAVMAKLAHAGPLTPPAGQVRSSGKTLDTVEPRIPITAETCPGDATCTYRITQAGSYYTVSNAQGSQGLACVVRVSASNVSVDMRGCTISGGGGGGAGGALSCISVDDGLSNIELHNGYCRDTTTGLSAGRSQVSVADIDCDGCAVGMLLGSGSCVSDCLCRNCGTAGFSCPDDAATGTSSRCTLDDCIAISCGTGFACGSDCCCANCRTCTCTTGYSCGARYTGDSSICTSCITGFVCGDDCCLDECVTVECESGITCGLRASVCACCVSRGSAISSVGGNSAAITVGDGSDCDDCCVDNPTGAGYVGGASCSFTCCSCLGVKSGYYAMQLGDGCDVCECCCTDCWGGVLCGSTCSILDNVCIIVAAGAGGGPHVRCASHCRVEDNSFDNAPIGVQLVGGSTGTMVCSNSFHRCPVPVEAVAASNAIAPLGQVANGGTWSGVSPLSNIVH